MIIDTSFDLLPLVRYYFKTDFKAAVAEIKKWEEMAQCLSLSPKTDLNICLVWFGLVGFMAYQPL